jgi:hypothetical protein
VNYFPDAAYCLIAYFKRLEGLDAGGWEAMMSLIPPRFLPIPQPNTSYQTDAKPFQCSGTHKRQRVTNLVLSSFGSSFALPAVSLARH